MSFRIDCDTLTGQFQHAYPLSLQNQGITENEFLGTLSAFSRSYQELLAQQRNVAMVTRLFSFCGILFLVILMVIVTLIGIFVSPYAFVGLAPLMVFFSFLLFGTIIYARKSISEGNEKHTQNVNQLLQMENQKYNPRGVQLFYKKENFLVPAGRNTTQLMFRPYLEFVLISPQHVVLTTTVVTNPVAGYQNNSGMMGEQAMLSRQPLISGNIGGYQTNQTTYYNNSTASSNIGGGYYQQEQIPNPSSSGLYQQQSYPIQQQQPQLPIPLYSPDNITNNFNQAPHQEQNDPPVVYYQQQQQTSNKDYQKF